MRIRADPDPQHCIKYIFCYYDDLDDSRNGKILLYFITRDG